MGVCHYRSRTLEPVIFINMKYKKITAYIIIRLGWFSFFIIFISLWNVLASFSYPSFSFFFFKPLSSFTATSISFQSLRFTSPKLPLPSFLTCYKEDNGREDWPRLTLSPISSLGIIQASPCSMCWVLRKVSSASGLGKKQAMVRFVGMSFLFACNR